MITNDDKIMFIDVDSWRENESKSVEVNLGLLQYIADASTQQDQEQRMKFRALVTILSKYIFGLFKLYHDLSNEDFSKVTGKLRFYLENSYTKYNKGMYKARRLVTTGEPQPNDSQTQEYYANYYYSFKSIIDSRIDKILEVFREVFDLPRPFTYLNLYLMS